jgi:hypothetical protein
MSEYTQRDAQSWDDLEIGPVLALRASLNGWSTTAEQQFWDEFLTRCESQQLFAGGSAEAAVVYAFDARRLPRVKQLLRNFLMSRIDADSFQLNLVDLRWLRASRLRLAANEAVASAQYYLFERALATTQALAAVASAAAVRPEARVSEDGASLEVTFRKQEIVMTFTRTDAQPEPAFAKFRDGMRAGEFHELIASPAFLRWEPLPPGTGVRRGDWAAELGPWRVHVCAIHDSLAASHGDVMRRWLSVLAEA